MKLKRLVLLTGVSRGLGRAMTDGLIARGHTVAGCSRSADAIDELAARYPEPNRFECVDVADAVQVKAWVNRVAERAGVPDLVINNAALINRSARLWEVPDDEFSRVIDVNIKGIYHVIRNVLPMMIEHGAGVIVNFSSGWGRAVSPEVAPYCATKWAVEGMTAAMASELPVGLAAVALNPGIIHTEMLESCFGDGAASYPDPAAWAKRAVPFLLGLGPEDNGRSLTVA